MKLTRLHRPLLVGLMSAILVACAPLPHQPRTTMQIEQVISPNFDQRRPNLVIIHHTSDDTLDEALSTLTNPERKVSAHYLIGRDGSIVQLVDENHRAWHAGKSWWGGFGDINSASLGIELDNNGYEPFPEAQIEALLALMSDIRQRYAIPTANFIGHADVALTRKDDPSILFPWRRLAENGFGLWCDAPLPPAPAGFDLAIALTALGYDPTTFEASVNAFRRHYTRGEQTYSSEQDNALAYCLWKKKSSPSQ